MAMRRTGGAVSALLLASSLPLVLGATKTTTAKWTQTKATVIVKFPLTRGSGKQFTKCTDEAARVEGEPPRFVFTTVCGSDTHQLDVPLFSGVTGEPELKANSRRTEVVVTMTKSKVKEVWKHLTATPEKYKALISRAPAPYEKLEVPKTDPAVVKAQETQRASVGPNGRVSEFDPEEQRRSKLIDLARDQTKEKRVTASTLEKLRTFIAKHPRRLGGALCAGERAAARHSVHGGHHQGPEGNPQGSDARCGVAAAAGRDPRRRLLLDRHADRYGARPRREVGGGL